MRQRGNRLTKTSVFLTKSQQIEKNKEKERREGIKSNHRKRKIRFRKCLRKQKRHHRLRLNFSNLRKSPSKATDFIESRKFKEWYERKGGGRHYCSLSSVEKLSQSSHKTQGEGEEVQVKETLCKEICSVKRIEAMKAGKKGK